MVKFIWRVRNTDITWAMFRDRGTEMESKGREIAASVLRIHLQEAEEREGERHRTKRASPSPSWAFGGLERGMVTQQCKTAPPQTPGVSVI